VSVDITPARTQVELMPTIGSSVPMELEAAQAVDPAEYPGPQKAA
jgi:hypothetical protein